MKTELETRCTPLPTVEQAEYLAEQLRQRDFVTDIRKCKAGYRVVARSIWNVDVPQKSEQ